MASYWCNGFPVLTDIECERTAADEFAQARAEKKWPGRVVSVATERTGKAVGGGAYEFRVMTGYTDPDGCCEAAHTYTDVSYLYVSQVG